MSRHRRTSAELYHPETFQERGVAVPFTTPILGGTRVRAAARYGIELITRNPADGRGVFITPWTDGALLWRPTLHDRVLIKRILGLAAITPATVLWASRATAAEGLAGEAAMEAALAALTAEDSMRAITCHRLLVDLINQVNIGGDPSNATLDPSGPDLDALARRTNDWVSSHLGQPRNWVAGALEALADLLAWLGEAGRIPALIALLRQTHDEIAEWSRGQFRVDRTSWSYTVAAAAELAVSLATRALVEARRLSEDMVQLLRIWAVDPGAITRLATRPGWLLDGWEQICLIWNYAQDDAGRYAALLEVAEYVLVMPREANDWSGDTSDLALRRPDWRDADWRNGSTMFDLIARNEHFRAIAC